MSCIVYFRIDTYICSACQFLGSDEDDHNGPEIADKADGDEDDEDEDEDEVVSDPDVLASVNLASTVGELLHFCVVYIGSLY